MTRLILYGAVLRGVLRGLFSRRRLVIMGDGRAVSLAYGDGRHDDTANIQAALNHPAVRVVAPPYGTYSVTNITIRGNRTLDGGGGLYIKDDRDA